MNHGFELDPFPGKPKILFIGHASSTHTYAWIDLMCGAELNVRLFALPSQPCPPMSWKVRTYLTIPNPPEGLDQNTRKSLYPTPEALRQGEQRKQARSGNPVYRLWHLLRRMLALFGLPHPDSLPDYLQPRAPSLEQWLAQIIRDWQPDIVHTLGLDPAGYLYDQVCRQFNLGSTSKWVLQLRGGSDLTLSRFDHVKVPQISAILRECDQIVSDNQVNFRYAREMGLRDDQISAISPIPGTGGVDVAKVADSWKGMPSQRRMILWPKAYDCPWSAALPVMEAIQIAWDHIQPCTIYMLAMLPDTMMWYNALPNKIRECCFVYNRIPREQVLALMVQARVMLAPSLVDGIPNSIYEAMAAGAFPIVSPLETITQIVESERNVLFARNLYPQEIADALIRVMNDDALVDAAARQNLLQVKKLADRAILGPKVIAYYQALAGKPFRI